LHLCIYVYFCISLCSYINLDHLNSMINFLDPIREEHGMVHYCPSTTHQSSLDSIEDCLQVEALEITMKLESTPIGESSSGMSQIMSQLTSLSLQVEDMKKNKGKDKREDIWCVRCRSEGHDKEHCPLFNEYLASGAPSSLKKVTLPWCEVCGNKHCTGECYYMQRYV
jgi:hypothetical protein